MITTVLAALTTFAVGSTIPVAGNATSAMQWTGPSKGVHITLYGTASEIMSQLKALDPEWIPVTERPGYVPRNSTRRSAELEARGRETGLLCCPVIGQNFQTVSAYDLQQAAQALLNIGGNCLTKPDSCALAVNDKKGSPAACDNGAGIYLCDPTPSTFIGANCADVGNYANDIISNCLGVDGNSGTYVCGQAFDSEGYNVIANSCFG